MSARDADLDAEQEVDLGRYWNAVVARWWLPLAGLLVGALIGWGIPEDRAKEYETGIREGGTVLGVTPRSEDDASFFENEWKTNYRGEHVYR